ncbi:MAG TPA: SPOR domain-containing protein [Candidatus Binataceae bacterium]|nr:SPOR domain-containing protein [Candidatus Binataceae bacterium]
MRFEVKTGGIIAICLGVALLSGAVFMLGLLAGYDVGRENVSDNQQVATDYSLPAQPAVATTPVAQASSGESARIAESDLETGTSPQAAATAAAEPRVAKAAISVAARPTPPSEALPPDVAQSTVGAPPPTPPANRVASATIPPPHDTRRKPFNIQIQAAMDSASASQMIKRLQILGYQPHTVPTTINGATWYRVEVGPYATQTEAAAAEADLRQKYNATFGGGGSPAQPADNSQSDE